LDVSKIALPSAEDPIPIDGRDAANAGNLEVTTK
jgi:hypothetical protein